MTVTARMTCRSIEHYETCRVVKLMAVYSNDKASPNYSFAQATPTASFDLSITNPAAFNQFQVGKTYDIEMSEYVPVPVEPVGQLAS